MVSVKCTICLLTIGFSKSNKSIYRLIDQQYHADSPKLIVCKAENKKCGMEFCNDNLMAAVQFDRIQMD